MIPRYTNPEMGKIWEENSKFGYWLKVEKAVCKSQAEMGIIPRDAAEDIVKLADFNVDKINEIELKTNHDVISFLTDVSSYIGDSSKYLHYGLTSSDVVDTALSLQIIDSINIIIRKIKQLAKVLISQAQTYGGTVMVGRTHGIHAEPVTFGFKIAVWAFEMQRNLTRMMQAKEAISYGKISGAVGTYANTSPELEKKVCELLGLKPSPASTQVLQRDRHAQVLCAITICGATLEKIALEVRSLQRTDTKEVEEAFSKGQKGSSAMPHKRNPIICERICGLARVLRSNAMASFENIALWHERDISHSSAERIIIPDSFILLDYLLDKTEAVVKNFKVLDKNMARNLMKYGGIIFSQRVLLELINRGLSRDEAYRIVQSCALKAWDQEGSFKENILNEKKVADILGHDEIEKLFDVNYHLQHINTIIKRLDEIDLEEN
ncbi:MAG: adenylosuccinate lyase [Actinobacteria bacterium]|nr:adenylosuccinate lyase [Actinomycetota bacterium]